MDDESLMFGCYGDLVVVLLNFDVFVVDGILFWNVFVIMVSCSVSCFVVLFGLYNYKNG